MTAASETVQAAKLLKITGRFVVVECPWCGCQHAHPASSRGSAEVVAPCHKPYEPLRSYRIPRDYPKRTTP